MFLARRLALVVTLCLSVIMPVSAGPLLVVDRSNLSVLYAQDAGQPWHPASLTKLMTAYVTFEELAKGTITLDTPVKISKAAVALAPSKSGLAVDSAISLKDALYLLIVRSANDVAYSIGETIGGTEANFVVMMNDVARRMGLSGTNFVNAHGLHNAAQVTTARDIAVLSLYIEQTYPQFMPLFQTGEVRINKSVYESNNTLLTGFAGTNGMKTGFICASGLNIVATVDRNGRRLLAVVLGASSGRERNERAAEMFLSALNGRLQPTGQNLLGLTNNAGAAPVDMRPQICGAEAATYVKAQEASYPYGLKDQPSFLTDDIPIRQYTAVDLGRVRNVTFPTPRPPHTPMFQNQISSAPAVTSSAALTTRSASVPFPTPRPVDLR